MAPPIKITGCRVFLNRTNDKHLKGFATIILNGEFAICDLKIIMGHKGLFVAMPSRRRKDGTFRDVAHPVVQSLREHIEMVVLDEYRRLMESPPMPMETATGIETSATAQFANPMPHEG